MALQVVVVAGGDRVPLALRSLLPAGAAVICADSGLHHALALGLEPTLVVGDMDSVDVDILDAVERNGVTVERHPTSKDETDLELALQAAVALGATGIDVVGGHGGRLDHLLANVGVLTAPHLAEVDVVAHLGVARATVVRAITTLAGTAGDLVTLLPAGGPAEGVITTGLRYPLHGEMLHPWSGRGVSNEFAENEATVAVSGGVLVAIQPHALSASASDGSTSPSPQEEEQ